MGPRHDLRYRGDRDLHDALMKKPRVADAAADLKKKGPGNLRRELLGSALRLTHALAPEVVDLIERCRGGLGIGTAVEVYVYPSPEFNAGCTNTEGGRVFILLSSSLVDAFAPDELAFVVGHELGHHLFDHHSIPAVALAKHDPTLALDLFAWQRSAEISADRAGLACTSGLTAAGAAMFKLTSGLEGERVAIHVEELLAQAAELAAEEPPPDETSVRHDWLTTHPFSPLRVRALQLAHQSQLFTPGGATLDELETAVHGLLHVMTPDWVREHSEAAEALRRLFFAAGILVASASEGVVDEEIAALEKLLGPDSLPEPLRPEAVREVLPSRMERVREVVPAPRRAQIVRDLCVVARADGRTDPHERALLEEVARGIGVDTVVVDAALATSAGGLD
jgi:hypothetical protein